MTLECRGDPLIANRRVELAPSLINVRIRDQWIAPTKTELCPPPAITIRRTDASPNPNTREMTLECGSDSLIANPHLDQ
jgi:hypothetical protein